MTMENKKNRIEFLDIARTFAIISVVLCHSVELIYNMKLEGWENLSVQSQMFRTICFTIGRLGVPIFLLITGYLILNKQIDNDDDVINFYKKNLLPLVVTTEIWIVIYNIFIPIYTHERFEFSSLIKNMLFIEQVPLMNMWYMPMIIGMYIALPFVSKIMHTFSMKSLKFAMIIVFLLKFLLPTINVVLNIWNLKLLGNIIDIGFLGGGYGLYIVSGYLISRGKLKKEKSRNICIIGIISFVLACVIQIISYNNLIEYAIWYDSVFIYICTICIFELCTRINIQNINKRVINASTYISKISLSIFFLHIIIAMIATPIIGKLAIINPVKVLILFTVTFGISIIIILGLSKIKIIKEKVLLIK